VLEAAIAGRIELVVPAPAARELERVLREKFGYSKREAAAAAESIASLAVATPEPAGDVPELTGDRDDDHIIAAALAGEPDVLVSGDRRHVLPLEAAGTMRIVTPQALLAELA
jgi:predicted nucleic acid-binding protein